MTALSSLSKLTSVVRPDTTTTIGLQIWSLVQNPAYRWQSAADGFTTVTYSFPWKSSTFAALENSSYSTLGEPLVATALSSIQQAAFISCLDAWSSVANLKFTQIRETSSDVGNIRAALTSKVNPASNGQPAWGWTYELVPNAQKSGDIWIYTKNIAAPDTEFAQGTYNYYSLMHEIGHALGMKHPFETPYPLDKTYDVRNWTVMSYTDPAKSAWVQVSKLPTGQYQWVSQQVVASTPMLLDVAAIQYMYGANMSSHTGDDNYAIDPNSPQYQTIWDAGGVDSIDASKFSLGCTIDLHEGAYSSLGYRSNWFDFTNLSWTQKPDLTKMFDGENCLAIAYGVTIENAVGGSADDEIIGNDQDNKILGGNGADTLIGNGGNDHLMGGSGDDQIDGGAGLDTALFSFDHSHYTVLKTSTGWQVSDVTPSGEGIDSLVSVERLNFSDIGLALDEASVQTVAKILGAVFGKTFVENPFFVNVGLNLLDDGMSDEELTQLALEAKLGSNYSEATLIQTLYYNLTSVLPSQNEVQYFEGLLTTKVYTKLSLTTFACDSDINVQNIDLTGIVSQGLFFELN